MKLIWSLVITCFFLTVHLSIVRGKLCRTGDHCRKDECCMTKSTLLGGCRLKGSEGSRCLPNNEMSHLGDIYLMECPCIAGLECVPQSIIKHPDKTVEYVNSTCQKSNSS
ncbi:hypothetical protein X975_22025, partial [Stegodyphus mimosarum]